MSDLIVTATKATAGFINSDLGRLATELAFQAAAGQTDIRQGRQLEELQVLGAAQGTPVPRLFGRMRIGGQLLWVGKIHEHVHDVSGGSGSKGGGGNQTVRREYSYHLSFAVGLCDGPVSRIGRIWADGQPLDAAHISYRFHAGDEDQMPDPVISGSEANAPAYRGLAYVVFDRFDLTPFGNRIPQLNFEVFGLADETAGLVRAVNLIPGASEFGYDTKPVIQALGAGRATHENTHVSASRTDWQVSLDDLQDNCPSCDWVALVVSWFGSDLRAADCRLTPRVESHDKHTVPEVWHVAGLSRQQAQKVTTYHDRPAFGGTPSDDGVRRCLADLKQRGLKVMFYPFIMMDIAGDNNLPDPYGKTRQSAYPWRGRITCHPAPGVRGSVDAQPAAAAQVEKFFYGDGTRRTPRWGLAHMIRHYARLCAEAGGVDAFLLGSEFAGLSQVRSGRLAYPFAAYMRELAKDVRRHLPAAKLSYAADWSEYGAHYVSGVQDLDFPLDELWADDEIDFVGIDNYLPLSDWREGRLHLDSQAGTDDIHDPDYLKSNIEGGEYYDWYYPDKAARDSQTREPITDGLGKPWLYRQKDFMNWWSRPHIRRRGGIETTATGWKQMSKPIWFTEIGCPAVDKGTNQPNRFPDPKSAESGFPWFSNGQRDDDIQRRYIRAMLEYWADPQNNPESAQYAGRMLAADRIFIWCWDARPYPAFPYATHIWIDGFSWSRGHWINGRLTATPLADICHSVSHGQVRLAPTAARHSSVEGLVLERLTRPREVLENIMRLFALEAVSEADERTGGNDEMIVLQSRSRLPVTDIPDGDRLVQDGLSGLPVTRHSGQDLPDRVTVNFIDASGNYEPASVSARRHETGNAPNTLQFTFPMVLSNAQAQALAERLLAELWIERERLRIALPPRYLYLQTGDLIRQDGRNYRITRIVDHNIREIEAVRHEPQIYTARENPELSQAQAFAAGPILLPPPQPVPELIFADLPALPWQTRQQHGVPVVAAYAAPWRQGVEVTDAAENWRLDLPRPCVMGVSKQGLAAGPVGRWDYANYLDVEIYGGELESRSPHDVLAGANIMALETPDGWEVLQFAQAELRAANSYRLSHFLRGQLGTDAVMAQIPMADARCFLPDTGLRTLPIQAGDMPHQLTLHHGPAGQTRQDYGWSTTTLMPQRVGLKPFAPVHAAARHLPDGGLRVTWIRRSRIGGDDWVSAEIPLDEMREAYQLKLYDKRLAVELYAVQVTTPRHDIPGRIISAANLANLKLEITQTGQGNMNGYPAIIYL